MLLYFGYMYYLIYKQFDNYRFLTGEITMPPYSLPFNQYNLTQPIDQRIMNVCYDLLTVSITKNSRVFVMRLDVHLPQEIAQEMIKTFNQRFIEKEKNAGYDPLYIMVREVSSQGNIHYHMALFLDGNMTRNTYQHFQNAERVLQNIMGSEYFASGLVDQCNHGHRNGIMIERNAINQFDLDEVLRQLSYLAKVDQKEHVHGKTFFYSRYTLPSVV